MLHPRNLHPDCQPNCAIEATLQIISGIMALKDRGDRPAPPATDRAA